MPLPSWWWQAFWTGWLDGNNHVVVMSKVKWNNSWKSLQSVGIYRIHLTVARHLLPVRCLTLCSYPTSFLSNLHWREEQNVKSENKLNGRIHREEIILFQLSLQNKSSHIPLVRQSFFFLWIREEHKNVFMFFTFSCFCSITSKQLEGKL